MKLSAITLILFLTAISLNAQTRPKTRTFIMSSGYFADILQFLDPGFGDPPEWVKINPKAEGVLYHGNSFSFEYRSELDSIFDMGFLLSKGTTQYYYNDYYGLYWDQKGTAHFLHVGLIFTTKLLDKKRTVLSLSIGPTFRHYSSQSIDEQRINFENTQLTPPINIYSFWDFGGLIRLEYNYKLSKHFHVGANIGCHNIWQLGIETVFIQPSISYSFSSK